MTLAERFAQYVEPEPNSGCWLWTGAQSHGYGAFSVGHARAKPAPRIAWQIEHGNIPAGMHVLHICDTPPCVNPRHLELGTHQKNMRDAYDRRLMTYPPPRRGWANNKTKLSVEQIREIRTAQPNPTRSLRGMARDLGISWTHFKRIRRSPSYREVG